ncbi:hypothetical protein V491_09464 [Pseudogymnoascus sp. VKM F-3775]|nr:hypothetical protein V491_09464 [Pseudogymnoascus sp. VKM F-3775]
MPKARRMCPHCEKAFNTGNIAEHRRSCANQKSTCPVCYKQFIRERDHKRYCKGTLVELPTYLAQFPDFSKYNWREELPGTIPGLTPIHEASDATKSLWHRMPCLVHINNPVPEQDVYVAVNKSINTLSFHAYKNGLAVHGAGHQKHTPLERKAMKETAFISMHQAVKRRELKSTKPTLYSDRDPLCYVLNVWTEDIPLSPPAEIVSKYLLCGDTTQTGINVTPGGSCIGLHFDIGRSGYSVVFDDCVKVILLFPPTERNLGLFASTAGLPNRLARIGDQLEGGLIARIDKSLAIDLPSCALHAVFTTVGGFLGGINFSIVEELPIMAQAILAHLPFFERDPDAILEDIKIYLSALVRALSLSPPHDILISIIKSWLALDISMASIDSPSKWCQDEKEYISAALNKVRPLQCNCSAIGKGTHLVEEHFEAV